MKNLFNYFMNNVLQMAHEDPPTGNGGNSGTNTDTGIGEGPKTEENLNNGEDPSGKGGNSEESSGGTPKDDGTPKPNVGVGVW